ncbi:DUF2059 domain-containing protein [Devosia faecipullorum]|uniref:DUF2059 domain-containing protein n=1 Tax=Devosia faecipullorum TaxID=2755039 RepID=UPI00187B22DC|nr:DUF2059 domain-containing protein [Devosia faecipullorum]MBE7733611.1 DUF2059 domain-containing protein [Devosia faecipullorum]
MAFWNGNMMRGAKAVMGVVLTAGIMAMSAPLLAQEVAPEQLAMARKYVDLTDRGAVFETTVVEVGIDTMRQIVTQNPEILDQTNETIGDVIKEYNGRKGELLDQFARVYAMRFTMEELTEIVNFYESATGQKLAAANSEVNTDIRRILQVYTNNLRTEFFAKVRSGLRAKGVEI